ncbi:hypothetical protein [Bacillus cereus]|uniref:hypothetical protein n=1 Tax=Bacillus cereus TaxID=1396 RepID=UPI001115065A|nr:hypothetical protein [Bacillus cereus]
MNCRTGVVNHASVVVASICEVLWNGNDWAPYGGNATMSITNVIPKDGGDVEVWGRVFWGSPIDYQISLMWL